MRNRVKELRKLKGLTQERLGELVHVSRQTIVSIEKEKYDPSLKLAYSISGVFGLIIEQVFIFKEENDE